MVRYSSFVTPDQRLRRLEGQTRREVERKQELDLFEQRRSQEIQSQIEREQARGAELDQVDSLQTQIETERARGLELDKRERGQPSTIVRDFQPSPSPSGRFVDRLEPGGTAPPPQPTVGFERLTAEEQQVSFEGGFPLNLETPARKAQHLWLRRAGQLTQEGLSVEDALEKARAEVGPAIEKQFTPETRSGLAGRFERGLPEVVGGVGKGISAVDEAAFQVNQFINEQLGTPPEQQPRREDFSVLGGQLTEGQVETLRTILPEPIEEPVIREAEFLSSPAGLAATLAWPAFVLRGAVGGVALAGGARVAGAGEEVEIGAQVAGNILTPGAGLVPNLSKITGGLKGTQATAYVTRLTEEITTAKSAAAALRKAGLTSKADELEHFAQVAEGSLARAEGRALVSGPTGAVIGEGALIPTRAEIGALQTVRATIIGDVSAPEFAQTAVRADVRATGETISSQVLQPRPQTGPAILETRVSRGVQQALTGEAGGGLLRGGGEAGGLGSVRKLRISKMSDSDLVALRKTSSNPDVIDEAAAEIIRRSRTTPEGSPISRYLSDAVSVSPEERAVSEGIKEGTFRRPSQITPETAADFSAARTGPLRGGGSPLRVEGGQIIGGEQGGGTLAGIGEAKDFFGRLVDPLLPQGGIPGGFQARPKGMRPGAKVTGLTQEGEQVEGTLIQVSGEKAIIRDAAGNVRPVTAPELVEAVEGAGVLNRLKDIGRDFRFGPSSRTAVPSLDPSVQKFVKVLRTAKPTQRTLKAERAEELGRRAAKGRVPFEAEARTPEEALAGLRRAQKGPLPAAADFEVKLPSGERGVVADAFTQEEVTNFINIARFSPALDRELFTRGNILESLLGSVEKPKGILLGRLPTPGELKNLERVYGAEFARELQKLRPFGERFWRLTLDALNIPRSFLAAFDLSFPFRQGVFAFARHPKEFFGNLPAMLRAAKNPEFAEQMVAAIKNDRTLIQTTEGFRPLNELMEEARLFLPDISGTEAFEARAEEFLSQLAHRIPGVGFSERGFIAYGDKLRSDIFRNTLQSWARQSKPATADEIADLGIMLNVLTGRGNLPPELAKSLSFGFFAPRFAASRPQLFLAATVNNLPGARRLTGTVLGAPGQTTRVARLASQELVTSVGAGLTILALVKASGAGDVELNPLSSDFGKIRIGKTRIDFWGGARPWATVIARMITGKRKTATGFVVPQGLVDTLTAFGRSKLAPPAALLVDVSAGETAIGEEVGTTGDILNRTLPLAIQDIKDAVEQEGATAGLLSTAAFLGVGFQTYETPGEKKRKAFEETFPSRTYQATTEDNAIVRDAIAQGKNKEALEDAFQPSPAQVETEEARVAEATELGLFTLSQAVNRLEGMSLEEMIASGSEAGPEFIEAWEDYKDRVSGAVFEAVFGKDRRGSEEYLAWRDIKLRRDPVTSRPLWDEYFEAKDAAFAKLDPLLQRALKRARAPGNDPTLLKTVEAYESARNLRRESFNLSRWIGIDAERSQQITEVQRLAAAKNRELAAQGSPDVPSEVIYELVGLDIGDAALARQAWFVRPGSKEGDELRDPQRDRLLVSNADALFRFFPGLYREELLNIVGDLERAGVR